MCDIMPEFLECPGWPHRANQDTENSLELRLKRQILRMYEFTKWVPWKKLSPSMRLKGGILFPDARFLSVFWLGYTYIPTASYVFTREGCIKIGRGDGLGPEQ